MIKLKCPECDSDKVIFISSELNEEDCFECEECNIVYPLSEMGWESDVVDCSTHISKRIDKLPTVEQLKECEYVYDAVRDEDNYVIDTEKAIEIVKGVVKHEYISSNNYNSVSNNTNN